MQFTVIQKDYPPMKISLNQPGMHNVQNACAAIAIARELDVADADTQKALTEFNGVGRRFTRYGDIALRDADGKPAGSFTLVDDYGHHPVETAATIAAARGTIGMWRLRAASTSGLFGCTAVEVTTASAPSTFSAAWPCCTLAPNCASRRVAALLPRSDPDTP